MKIINHPSIIRASTVEFDEHTLPHRVVLRSERSRQYIVHNECLKIVLVRHDPPLTDELDVTAFVSFAHDGFDTGAYFSDLEAAAAYFVERVARRGAL